MTTINGQLIEIIIIIIRREVDDKGVFGIPHVQWTVNLYFPKYPCFCHSSRFKHSIGTFQFDDKIRWTFLEENSGEVGVLC